MIPDERWLQRKCRKWQRRLGLLDWHPLPARFVPVSELTEGTYANCGWEPDDMTSAYVSVAHPPEIETDDPMDWYIESCIIHELIHLLFYGHLPVPEYNVNDERAINKITLVLLPRKKAGK